MTTQRASVFEQEEGIDVSGFAPKERVKEIARQGGFSSRGPIESAKTSEARREPRRYRTGRNVQLNLKVRPEDVDAFYALADRTGLVLGEVFEKAIAALARELADQ